MFQRVYNQILSYSEHPQAMWILALIAFVESFISPIPPDVLLIPMMIAKRERIPQIALVCTVSSLVGGVVGYWFGYALYDLVGHYIVSEEKIIDYNTNYSTVGFIAIAIKGFLPIPYKVVAVIAGLAHYNFVLFMIASFIARASRFFMLAILVYIYGEKIKEFIEKNLALVMIGGVLLIIGTIYLVRFF
jgi:membrane protein YqaA with SNARE-associated domain